MFKTKVKAIHCLQTPTGVLDAKNLHMMTINLYGHHEWHEKVWGFGIHQNWIKLEVIWWKITHYNPICIGKTLVKPLVWKIFVATRGLSVVPLLHWMIFRFNMSKDLAWMWLTKYLIAMGEPLIGSGVKVLI